MRFSALDPTLIPAEAVTKTQAESSAQPFLIANHPRHNKLQSENELSLGTQQRLPTSLTKQLQHQKNHSK